MKRTIQQLREDRRESRSDLAQVLGVTLDKVTAWEQGQAEPTVLRLRDLTEHFGVRDDQIELEPRRPPSVTDRLAELF